MNDEWKDKPHWVLRFTDTGIWELAGPDGADKSVSGLGQQTFSVHLAMNEVPSFDMGGILFVARQET